MLPPFPAAGHKPAACERDCQSALVTLPSFAFAARRDPLDRHALDAVACGISSRKYARSLDTLPEEIDERSVSKSSVSRRYVDMTTKQMTTWLTTPAAVTGSVGAGAGIPLMGVPVPIAFAALQVRTEAVPPGPGSDLRAGF
jgi:hypothetical protein